MKCKNPVFICLVLFCSFVAGTVFPLQDDAGEKIFAASSSLQSSDLSLETKESEAIPDFNPGNSRARGIILGFYHWPDEEEKTLILERTAAAGLKKTIELPLFKSWIFEWPELEMGIKAIEVCDSLSDIPSLEYCEPDYLLGPATNLTR